MPFHPAHSLFVLLESTDLNNEEHLIRFVKENQKFQLKIQDGLLHAHMNRLRIKEGKEPKKVLEIGADDAVPFRIALILDYLSMLPIEQARAYYDKVLEILRNFDSVLAKAPQNRKGDVVRWRKEKGFLTGLEAAFEAAERYDFKKPDNDDLEEAFVTIHDVQINASKENLFERILALEPSNNLAIVDFFQRAEQDLFNTKQFVFGDAITGLDEQLPLLIAFSTDIALRENIDSEKMQAILDKLMVVSNVFLETIRALPDGDMQDKLNEQYAWCFNLSSALSYITQNSTVDVLSDPQTFEYFSKLHHNKFNVVSQLSTLIRDAQKKIDKGHDSNLRSNIADTLLNPNASGDTVLGNLFKNPASNHVAIAFALQCVDLKDKRFANVICDEIPIDSPYLDLKDEKFLKKWLNEGLNINHQGEKTGNTLLHKRFQQGDSADVVTLLRQGANPTLKNYEGHTARASKPEHNISISAIMNYGFRYATKTLNNGVKRLWNGLRGKKEVLPTTLVQAINRSDEKLVVPLGRSESVVIQEMQQKKGVKFAGDPVELTEKKPLVENSTVLFSEPPKSEWKSVQPSHSNSQASLLMRKAIIPMASEHKGHKQKKTVVVNAELKVELALSSAAVASQLCIQQFQQALKELESGRLPSFCEANVSLRVARQACIDIIQKMSILEKAGKVEPTAIRMVVFDVGAGRVLRKENPLSQLRRTLERMENTSTSKFRPGGNPAAGA